MGLIMITHDLGVVAETCDKVAVVYAGEIIEMGSKEEIFDDPRHPYTAGLFGSIPKLAGDETRLHSISGMPPDPTNLPEGCKFHPRCEYCSEQCSAANVPLQHIGGTHYFRCIYAEGKR